MPSSGALGLLQVLGHDASVPCAGGWVLVFVPVDVVWFAHMRFQPLGRTFMDLNQGTVLTITWRRTFGGVRNHPVAFQGACVVMAFHPRWMELGYAGPSSPTQAPPQAPVTGRGPPQASPQLSTPLPHPRGLLKAQAHWGHDQPGLSG